MTRAQDPSRRMEESEIERSPGPEEESPAPREMTVEERDLRHLADRLARLEAEKEEMRQMLVGRQADFENFRKRVERERREDRERGLAALALSLLPVLDNFERALAAHQDSAYEKYRRGFEMIYRQLADLLAEHGILRMDDPAGKKFDPHLHHAFERVETTELPEGTVLGEVQAGYRFRDRVLRPAQVRVAVPPSLPADESGPN